MPNPVKGAFAAVLCATFCASTTAQSPAYVDWATLMDANAQVYEDPYRGLTRPQMERLMALIAARQSLDAGGIETANRASLEDKAEALVASLQAQGLDPDWILSQREAVASRRQRAALSINTDLDGERVEMSGYLLHTSTVDGDAVVTYLLPNRGVCMHLPPPAPNQAVRLFVVNLPETMGPCIPARLRGRLLAGESRYTIPSADGTTTMWSQWQMRVTEVTTSARLSAQADSIGG